MAEAPIAITATGVLASAAATLIDGIAGATITQGQAVYLDATTSTYKLADSNASAATANVVGIAINAASANQPVTVCTYDPDFTPGGTLSISVAASTALVCLSVTAGAMKMVTALTDLAAGEYPVLMGIAKSATKMVLKPVIGAAALTA